MSKKKVSKKITKKKTKKATSKSKSKKVLSPSLSAKKKSDTIPLNLETEFKHIGGKKLFYKICNILHEKVGYHVLNLFVFSSDEQINSLSVLGTAFEKPMSWGSTPVELETSLLVLKQLKKQNNRPEIIKFPASLFFSIKNNSALSLTKSPDWKDAKQSNAVYLPFYTSEGKIVGALLFALIDSPSPYAKNDLDLASSIYQNLSIDVFYEQSLLIKNTYNNRLQTEKENARTSIREIQSLLTKSKKEQILLLDKNNQIQKDHQEQLQAFHKKVLLENKAELSELKKQHNKNLKELQDDFSSEKENNTSLKNEINLLEKKIENLGKENETRLENLKEDRNRLIDSFSVEKQNLEIKNKKYLDEQIAEFENKNKNLILELNLTSDKKFELINKKHQEELSQVKDKHESQINRLQSQISEVEQDKKKLNVKQDEIRVQISSVQNHNNELEKKLKQEQIKCVELNNKIIRDENEIKKLNQNIQDQLNQIKLSGTKQTEFEKQIENLRSEISKLKGELQSKEEQIQNRQNNILNINRELEKTDVSLQELSAKEQDLKNIITQKDSRIEFLEKEVQEKAGRLQEQNTELKTRIDSVENEKQQLETNYHEKIYQNNQKLKTLTESFERKLEDAEQRGLTLDKQLKLTTKELHDLEAEYKKQGLKSEEVIANHVLKITSLENQLNVFTNEKKELEHLNSELIQKSQKNTQELIKIQSKLDSIETAHADNILILTNEHSANLALYDSKQKENESGLEKSLTEKLKLEERLNAEKTQNANYQEKIKKLELSAVELEEKLRQHIRSIADKERQILDATKQIDENKLKLTKNNENIVELNKIIKEQNAKIAIGNERNVHLEKNISDRKQEIQKIQANLNENKQTSRILQKTIETGNSKINEFKLQIQNHIRNETKLHEEVENKESRILNFKKEGRLLANLVNAIGNLPDLISKLNYLKNHLIVQKAIDRIVVFQLTDKDQLVFRNAIWEDIDFTVTRGFTFPLNQTTFAQVIATLTPRLVKKDSKTGDIDLPSRFKDHLINLVPNIKTMFLDSTMEEFLIIPLSINKNVNGVILLASKKKNAFTNSTIELADSVSSLFAVALEYENKKDAMQGSLLKQNTLYNILDFKRSRFVRQNNLFHSVILDTKTSLKKIMQNGDLKLANHEIILQLVSKPLNIPELRENDLKNIKPGLLQWIDQNGSIANEKTGLVYSNQISENIFHTFLDAIGDDAIHMFWFVTECFENAIAHSLAKNIVVRTAEVHSTIVFSIVDDGEGLIRTSGSENPVKGSGLNALKNIAILMGCEIEFTRDEKGYGLCINLIKKI